ncbi:NTP transferase domain-containing protein [uncultured Helicobacter sp.]|uniref:phosphocholine cytidylyltransferase family protein n=1 Tax=uncultured Helicobacter sp. TaxID=175537 RepID=UPI00374E212A
MRAIILAAGRGSRMKQATESKPKCLVELAGKPLLEYQLEALVESGIRDIGIVSGYRREVLAPFIKRYALSEFYNEVFLDSNMVYSLMCAKGWLEGEDFVISYSDIFYKSRGVVDLCRAEADVGVLYDVQWKQLWQARFSDPLSDAETFRLDSEGRLVEIGARAKSLDEIQGQFMGLIKCSAKGFENLSKVLQDRDFRHLDSTSLLNLYLTMGYPIHCIPYRGVWGECDSQNDVALYEQMYFYNNLNH